MRQLLHGLLLLAWKHASIPIRARRLFLRFIAGSYLIGALAVVEDQDGRVLLVKRTYDARRPWALPGGWVKQAEWVEQGLVREVREETGLRVSVGPVLLVRQGPYGEVVIAYRCTAQDGAPHGRSVEIAETRYFAPSDLPPLDPLYLDILRAHRERSS